MAEFNLGSRCLELFLDDCFKLVGTRGKWGLEFPRPYSKWEGVQHILCNLTDPGLPVLPSILCGASVWLTLALDSSLLTLISPLTCLLACTPNDSTDNRCPRTAIRKISHTVCQNIVPEQASLPELTEVQGAKQGSAVPLQKCVWSTQRTTCSRETFNTCVRGCKQLLNSNVHKSSSQPRMLFLSTFFFYLPDQELFD